MGKIERDAPPCRLPGFIADAPQTIASAVTLPRDAWRGDFETMPTRMSREEGMRVADLAGLAMTGSLPFKAPAGALRSFGGAAAKADPLADLELALKGLPQEAPSSGPRLLDPNARSWDLYHGSTPGDDFARFDPTKSANRHEQAVFLAPSAETASDYAGRPKAGAEAGSRVFRTTVEPGKTGVFDLSRLAETDPAFNARAREITVEGSGPAYGQAWDDHMSTFRAARAQDADIARQVEEMGFTPDPNAGTRISYGHGHIGAAIERAKAQGLDTAILRGLVEHGGDDQVVALTPSRVRSFYAPDEVLFSKAPVALAGGAGAVAALASPDTAQAAPAGTGNPMATSPFGFGPSPEDLARALAQLQAGAASGFSGAPSAGLPQQAAGPMAVRPFGFGGSPMPFTAPPGDLAVPQASNEADVQRLEQAMGMVPQAGAPAPVSRPPLSFGAPQRPAPMQAGATNVPLPPQRPAEFQTAQADMPAPGAQPIMAQGVGVPGSAATGEPSMFDRLAAGLGHPDVSDLLINIGSGLMTQRGFGPAIAAGVQANQAQEGRRAATDLARAEYGLKVRKLAQEQGGVNQSRALLIRKGYSEADADGIMAAYAAGDRTALNNAMNNAFPKNPDAPSGYRLNADGSASYIRGGPQDPTMREAEAAATARGTASAKGPDDFSLSPGQVRYSGTGQPIASARPDKPENFDTESKLRGEFSKQIGSFADVHDAYGRVIAATQEREKNPAAVSPASDMSLVFGFMKMLDPTSVVREGEYATAKNAGGIEDRFRNAYNKVLDGEFLTPQQRQDFVNQADALYGKTRGNAEAVAERYRGLAGQYGVDPGRSVYLPEVPKPPRVSGGRTGDQGGALGVGGTRDMGGGVTVRRVR